MLETWYCNRVDGHMNTLILVQKRAHIISSEFSCLLACSKISPQFSESHFALKIITSEWRSCTLWSHFILLNTSKSHYCFVLRNYVKYWGAWSYENEVRSCITCTVFEDRLLFPLPTTSWYIYCGPAWFLVPDAFTVTLTIVVVCRVLTLDAGYCTWEESLEK